MAENDAMIFLAALHTNQCKATIALASGTNVKLYTLLRKAPLLTENLQSVLESWILQSQEIRQILCMEGS